MQAVLRFILAVVVYTVSSSNRVASRQIVRRSPESGLGLALGLGRGPLRRFRRSQPVEGSLFASSDPVTQLSGSNIESTLEGASNAWVVNFYSAWCGHCRRFAPIWKELGSDVQGETRPGPNEPSVTYAIGIDNDLCR